MRRSYDKEFKMNAVKLSYSSGQKITVLEKELGIGRGNLNHWRREFEKSGNVSFPGKGNVKEENKKMVSLRKKLSRVRQMRDILKRHIAKFMCKSASYILI